jgi:hypothetical protein
VFLILASQALKLSMRFFRIKQWPICNISNHMWLKPFFINYVWMYPASLPRGGKRPGFPNLRR